MSYIIIYTTNNSVAKSLYNLEHGRKDGRGQKPHKELFIHSLTGNSTGAGVVKVMENNGFVLSYIAKLLKIYPNEVFVWVAERITFNQLPDLCKKGGLWLAEYDKRGRDKKGWFIRSNGRNLRYLPKYLNVSKEVLEKCKIEILVNTKE